MKVNSRLLSYFRLDRTYCLLSARNVAILLDFFKAMDVREKMVLDNIQFLVFMRSATDLSKERIYTAFDLLDVDNSGLIDFDEFYLLICILIAVRDKMEKEFIYRHSRTVFELLDTDGSNNISGDEFEKFGFLFNFEVSALRQIFKEFDITGDQALDYQEFRMFATACIDRQNEMHQREDQWHWWRSCCRLL